MTQEALKLALEALEEAWYHVGTFQPTEKAIDLYDEARTAIKEALAQPEPVATVESVATVVSESGNQEVTMSWWHEPALPVGTKLYTAPPQLEERNFCPRCGKRTKDIHTCTPPQRTEQEPVAQPASEEDMKIYKAIADSYYKDLSTPPQRTWVGLTDEEIKPCWYEACQTNLELTSQLVVYFAKAIEAKLKEKNT